MTQAIRRRDMAASDHLVFRAVSAIIVLTLSVLISSCAHLAEVSDPTIPKRITPLSEANFNQLVARLQAVQNFQTLSISRAGIRSIDAESGTRSRGQGDVQLALKRPDKIYFVVQVPISKSKITEMVSNGEHFKVAIYKPEEIRRFLIGTNNADYSKQREKLGREKQRGLANIRPFHFTDALMIHPLHIGDAHFVYSLEEALIEEPDTRSGAKKGARVLHSFYVITEAEVSSSGQAPSLVRRRFWFDRTDPQTPLARQQVFDERGLLTTEAHYFRYAKLSAESAELWPSEIFIMRPTDGYSVQLSFYENTVKFNSNLQEAAFDLKNTEGLPETDLDKTEGSSK